MPDDLVHVVLDVSFNTAIWREREPHSEPEWLALVIRDCACGVYRLRELLPSFTDDADVTLVDSRVLRDDKQWTVVRAGLHVRLDAEKWQARWGVAAADSVGAYIAAELADDTMFKHHECTVVCRNPNTPITVH